MDVHTKNITYTYTTHDVVQRESPRYATRQAWRTSRPLRGPCPTDPRRSVVPHHVEEPRGLDLLFGR